MFTGANYGSSYGARKGRDRFRSDASMGGRARRYSCGNGAARHGVQPRGDAAADLIAAALAAHGVGGTDRRLPEHLSIGGCRTVGRELRAGSAEAFRARDVRT